MTIDLYSQILYSVTVTSDNFKSTLSLCHTYINLEVILWHRN